MGYEMYNERVTQEFFHLIRCILTRLDCQLAADFMGRELDKHQAQGIAG
jgi:hypothetical protein